MSPRIGSLCSGYGGLDMAVQAVFGGELAWWSDIDDGAIRIMTHHHPGVPNLGDFTVLDWSTMPPVEILTAGYPCQPFSLAGQRKGTDDVRHLWPYIREAIRVLRPHVVVLENVAGHRSMGADRVLGDLAEDGLCVRWVSVRASDTGACHGRERFFMLAHTAGEPRVEQYGDTLAATDTENVGCQRGRGARDGWTGPENSRLYVTDWGKYEAAVRRQEAAFGRPAPSPVQPSSKGTPQLAPVFTEWMMTLPLGWVTDPAIWEGMLNAKGKPASKAAIRNAQLHALGNGVVPQQAIYALRVMLSWRLERAA